MDAHICPVCGVRRTARENGVGRKEHHNAAGCRSQERGNTGHDMLDRLMNWVVGVLLVAATSALIVFQAHASR